MEGGIEYLRDVIVNDSLRSPPNWSGRPSSWSSRTAANGARSSRTRAASGCSASSSIPTKPSRASSSSPSGARGTRQAGRSDFVPAGSPRGRSSWAAAVAASRGRCAPRRRGRRASSAKGCRSPSTASPAAASGTPARTCARTSENGALARDPGRPGGRPKVACPLHKKTFNRQVGQVSLG